MNGKTKLDGMWNFKIDRDGTGEEKGFAKKFPKDCERAVVPSCWNNSLGYYDYEGRAWYNRDFYFEGGNMLLKFNSVLNYAKVFLDGEFVLEHYGAHTAFETTVTSVAEGVHSLTVLVDNTHNSEDTIPLTLVDWYHYGGIDRSVEIEKKADFYVKSLKITYKLSDDMKSADVTAVASALGRGEKGYGLYVDGKLIKDAVLKEGENKISLSLSDIELWDTDNPALYTFSLKSGDDEKESRCGFRKIEVDGYSIKLNGRKITIRGVNRHEEHPDWGFAVPLALMKKDMDILRDMNVNCIRGSHYPNSQEFLDMCDESGMLFWSEIPLWQYHEQMANPLLKERAVNMISEMVEQYYNHPSIIIWGLLNECDTFSECGKEFVKLLYKTVKERDSSRLITFATDKKYNDISLEWCDFISLNNYTGWYEGTKDEWGAVLDKVDEHLKQQGVYHKPLVISEFGAAALYGECTFEQAKWSENYQDAFLRAAFEEFEKRGNICGTFVWQFADIRVCKERFISRARCFNNKGILNEYRKPKMAYYTVKDIYSKIK